MNIIVAIVISYLIGAFPTAYIFGRAIKGIDIRDYGSGNVGATNAMRVLGKGPGSLILLIDILKGILAVTLVGNILGSAFDQPMFRVMLGLVAVAGHNWTVFLNFKGGKGIAASLGVLIGLTIQFASLRPVLLCCIIAFLAIFLLTGYVSLGSIVSAVILPIMMVGTGQSLEMIILGVVFCIFVVLRHRSNIKRLLSGKEARVNFPFRQTK